MASVYVERPATAVFTMTLSADEMLTLAGLILGHATDIGDAMYDEIIDALNRAGMDDYLDRPAFVAAQAS